MGLRGLNLLLGSLKGVESRAVANGGGGDHHLVEADLTEGLPQSDNQCNDTISTAKVFNSWGRNCSREGGGRRGERRGRGREGREVEGGEGRR